jgi:hypothetical protein
MAPAPSWRPAPLEKKTALPPSSLGSFEGPLRAVRRHGAGHTRLGSTQRFVSLSQKSPTTHSIVAPDAPA